MAFNKDQQDSPLPIGNTVDRTSVDFLPRYFRTATNRKFLNATLDQMISEGEVEKINAFIGRKTTEAYKTDDKYLEDVSDQRSAYQLEPALTIRDTLNNYVFFKDYNDYVNQLSFFNANISNQDLVNSQEFYAWNPHIDWDKFINYREYYWLPSGPQSIPFLGQSTNIISTYTISVVDETDNQAYLFAPDGLTRNPTLKLYRGQTYRFEVDCEAQPIAFKTDRISGDSFFYTQGVSTGNSYVGSGVIEFIVPEDAPNILYYVSKNDINTSGILKIYDIDEATKIDVEKEVLGKKTYIMGDGTSLSNGMRVTFQGLVTPERYATGAWYVEGVGSSISLINENDLTTPASYSSNEDIEFDNEQFDVQGFDVNANYPSTKDYILINRSSKDRNPWSRYNRWFHREVIEASASINGQPVTLDQNARAKRPIIEFEAGLILWNHGRQAKQNVTLVDTFTQDIFSKIEGSLGYNVDGVDLLEGMRVLFTADTDIRVSGRIFRVAFITHLGTRRITLIAEPDTDPVEGETVLVLEGDENSGKMYHYSEGFWRLAQQKTSINQAPLFDVFDIDGVSYGDKSSYVGTTFAGTKLFSYAPGTVVDPELNFGIAYRNIGNIGDIVFDFNLHTDSFIYQDLATVKTIKLDRGYLRQTNGLLSANHVNGWTKADELSRQYVVRQFDASERQNFFPVDVYDNSGTLTDLEVHVWVNGKLQSGITDYSIFIDNNVAYINFIADLNSTDSVIIKSRSAAIKNSNGYYEFPHNLESNPLNISMDDFTLGEISNHLKTIVENNTEVRGIIPGPTNLRDLSGLAAYGRKIIQHSGPLAIAAYHITDKDHNIVKALRFAKDEYSKFKRNFLRIAESYGYDGDTRIHLDLLLREAVKDNVETMPYYFSDMVPFSASFIYDQDVIDDSITQYPITFNFDLSQPSQRAVLVYLNDQQLVYGREYEFVNTSFVSILVPIVEGDNIKVVQYESTDGCYIPPTPTKLGLYPAYEPKIFIDDTYQTPTKVIQGHDGSIVVAFDDYRDDLILELETRIFNNLKVAYNPEIFDIDEFITGYYRKTDLTTKDLNDTLRQEFLHWSRFIADDYTKHTFFDRNNPFTFNYKQFAAPDTTSIPGFWRAIYKYFYDTDRPHSHPWEILGYRIEPRWWRDVYGPAPYTSDNLILWNDIVEGIIREPGKLLVRKPEYARPTIFDHLPVDQQGVLLSPLETNLIKDYVAVFAQGEFTFGDQAPIESAWRKNSEYPFALITALTLLRPAKLFATAYDRVRQIRDDTGQIVYKVEDGILRFSPTEIVFPNTLKDIDRKFTSGLVNYICDYTTSRGEEVCENYKSNLRSLDVKIASKLGGFTSKEKFKLILDSRSPLNQGNVFIPEENYDIILNTSSPVVSINYSGVIVEKQPGGFILKGYNLAVPEFKYYKPLETVSDPVINVGGISESFLDWDTDKFYNKTQIVRYDNNFYRVTTSHTSAGTFELKYFAKLPQLPVTGGRDVILRRRFETEISTLHYGAELEKVQDVVDFMLGYNQYLIQQGFNFDYFNSTLETVTDWETSVKEFVFWTTQNWAAGSVIALSPGADEIIFDKDFSVVDNIYDNFYEYSIYKQDGLSLEPLFTNSVRKGNSFTLRPRNTADGIYHATLNLVQKEHVLILDNKTVFNDIIYDQTQGYRQERIKITGYRTGGWQGDFSIPGFIYDRAVVKEWKSWKDYALGETVKYKEFYYSAKKNTPGSETFDDDYWYRLPNRPESKLIPNWDYRANQFPDFYDLDTDSFDVGQQKFAQHLIGYQNRQYLENIINDDVAQYKFYQGMIREKGTQNVLSKLFDTLSASNKESIDFYEEWAIRIGQYGAVDAFKELEYKIDEEKMLINPQPFELVNRIDPTLNDFVYRYTPDQIYVKTEDYNHDPFPTTNPSEYFVNTAGYVRTEDVDYVISSKSELANYSLVDLVEGSRFWLGYDKNTWNVLRFSQFAKEVDSVEFLDPGLKIKLISNRDADIRIGDYIGVNTGNNRLDGIFPVVDVGFNYITITPTSVFTEDDATLINFDGVTALYKFSTVRTSTIDNVNDLYLPRKKDGDLIWVDGINNQWSVWQYNNVYSVTTIEDQADTFANNLVVDDANRILVITADDRVFYLTRPVTQQSWVFRDQINAGSAQSLIDTNGSFGASLSISKDGSYLLIGTPEADNVSGDSSSATGEGYVAIYKKNQNDIFVLYEVTDDDGNVIFDGVFKSSNITQFENFGFKTAIVGNLVYIASRGGSVGPTTLNLFTIDGVAVDRYQFSETAEITDMSVSETGLAVISRADETVHVLECSSSGITLLQVLEFGQLANAGIEITTGANFASSVAVTRDGKTIAVGAPSYSGINVEEGCVVIYSKGTTFEPVDLILNPTRQESGRFGDRVKFNIVGDQLVVRARTGDQTFSTSFDNVTTTFDLGSTAFKEVDKFTGAVFVFDKYDSKYVFSDDLETPNIGSEYGNALFVTNRVYVGDAVSTNGAVYEFSADKKSWSVFRQPDPAVDVKKIKSVFLYDTEQNSIISYIDFVDPLQGKILGLAEQELSYKTYYDPATYTLGTTDVVVDTLDSWTRSAVGRLWWDLGAVKFINTYQGTAAFKSNSWNSRFADADVAVYEWVESNYKPSQWDELADTEEGLTLGISGQSKYGDLAYSIDQSYDSLTQTYSNKYYFWVKNKVTVPDVEFRKYSAKDVSSFIQDPKSKGIRYVALLGSNQWSLVNCKELIADRKVAINFRYWTVDNTDLNIHSHYQLLTDGDISRRLNTYVEQKWIDSLIGEDVFGNPVPDPELPLKLRYGILNKPRQSMFVNRIEATKEFVERVNSVLIKRNLIDDFDLSGLDVKDPAPSIYSRSYDAVKPTYSELRFVGTATVRNPVLTPIISLGKIIGVTIVNAGRGFVDVTYDPESGLPRRGPAITVNGTGEGAQITCEIDHLGSVISVKVEKQGKNYSSTTTLEVRPFTVLIEADETADAGWSLYTWDVPSKSWNRSKTQTYDVTKYWRRADWYSDGFSEFTKIDHLLKFAYELPGANIQLGEVIKIENQGAAGWLLLKKIDDQETTDSTVNYQTIGRQNGTIQLNDNIYRFSKNNVGYDGPTYDDDVFDDQPKEEFRIILEVLKDNIFVDDLEIEYNQLFFASLRYVFQEQIFVDWAFKTSFVRGKHNLGELKKKVTYQNDNLESFEDYVNEVKPYRTKIREFVSAYERLEQTRSVVTDFDLPARFDFETGTIIPIGVSVKDGILVYDNDIVLSEPYDSWYYNVGHGIEEITVIDGGEGYTNPPVVTISGVSTVPAIATAYVSQGRVSKIVVENPGEGYLVIPEITLDGGQPLGGTPARIAVKLGAGPVRSTKVGIKFDRLNPRYTITSQVKTETFTNVSGSQTRFNLKWPIDLRLTKVTIAVGGIELLDSDYTIVNVKDTATYTRYYGRVTFDIAPAAGETVVITYNIDINLMDAADRIQFYYTDPKPGQLGQDLGQLMQGVDYGGVQITGIDFNIGSGWDSLPWSVTGWDSFDSNYTDQLFRSDGTTRTFTLGFVPADGEEINVYVNNIRVDDPNYDAIFSATSLLVTEQAALETLEAELVILQGIVDSTQSALTAALAAQISAQAAAAAALTAYNQAILDYGAGSPEAIAAMEFYISAQAAADVANTNAISATNAANVAQANVTAKQAEIVAQQSEIDSAQSALDSLDPIVNENAEMNTIYGDGDTDTFTLPSTVTLSGDQIDNNIFDNIIFRKATSDGSFIPEESTYDIQLSGGNLAYTSAVGINAEEINLDGDGFVTPISSHAPEEMVTGQVLDTVDIRVFHKVSDGAPTIVTKHYIAGSRTRFAIGQRPGTNNSVIVKIGGLVKRFNVDYVVDFINQEIELTTVPAPTDEVVITSLSQNGLGILDLDFFVGDGSTTEFITAARWDGDYSAFVTVDGLITGVTAFVADETYVRPGNIGIRFSQAPAADSVINYTILNTFVNTVSKIEQELIVHDGVSSTYELNNIPAFVEPLENHLIVETSGHVLRSVDTYYFNVSGTLRTYTVDSADYPFNTIDPTEIKVYKNGAELQQARDWTWTSGTNQLKLKQGVAVTGDVIALAILQNAEYFIEGLGSNTSIRFTNIYPNGTVIAITSFTNHDLLEVERSNDTIISTGSLTPGSTSYQKFSQLSQGRIKLEKILAGPEYIWIILNNELLTPSVDYILESDLQTVVIGRKVEIDDVVEIMTFNSDTTRTAFGYKIFKDMLNSVIYKRYDDSTTTSLAEPLRYYDPRITVTDATGLTEPNASLNQPGIIFIEGERIEYLKKTGNTLSQLRRGTLGTGIAENYPVGTKVRDQSQGHTVPYNDLTLSSKAIADGSSQIIPIEFIPMKNHIENGGVYKTAADWTAEGYVTSFAPTAIQADDIEVFVGGRRLRKQPTKIWDQAQGPDSPSGDINLDAEFAVDGVTATVQIADGVIPVADDGTQLPVAIVVQKRTGRLWTDIGESLADSDSSPAKFIRAKSINLRE